MERKWNKASKGQGSGDFNDITWDCDEMPELEGTLTEKKSGIGVHSQKVYKVRTEDGIEYTVWGTVVLAKFLEPIPTGKYIKIVFLGRKKNKSGSGSYKDFDLFIAEGEPEFDQAETTVAAAPEAQEAQKTDPALEAAAEEMTKEETSKEEEVPF